jgi:hypothetical protein
MPVTAKQQSLSVMQMLLISFSTLHTPSSKFKSCSGEGQRLLFSPSTAPSDAWEGG